MKCLSIAVAILIFFMAIPVQAQLGKVLMIVSEQPSANLELMLTKEVGVMKNMLTRAGFNVIVATVSGKPIKSDKTTFNADIQVSNVNVADYAGFILPCMAVNSIEANPGILSLIKKAVDAGKPIAAQTGSVVTLGRAGVLSGKKYSHNGLNAALKDGIYGGIGIVQDGKIITSSSCPYQASQYKGVEDGTAKLTEAFIAELKKRF